MFANFERWFSGLEADNGNVTCPACKGRAQFFACQSCDATGVVSLKRCTMGELRRAYIDDLLDISERVAQHTGREQAALLFADGFAPYSVLDFAGGFLRLAIGADIDTRIARLGGGV